MVVRIPARMPSDSICSVAEKALKHNREVGEIRVESSKLSGQRGQSVPAGTAVALILHWSSVHASPVLVSAGSGVLLYSALVDDPRAALRRLVAQVLALELVLGQICELGDAVHSSVFRLSGVALINNG